MPPQAMRIELSTKVHFPDPPDLRCGGKLLFSGDAPAGNAHLDFY